MVTQDYRRTVPVIFRDAVAEFDARVRQIGDHHYRLQPLFADHLIHAWDLARFGRRAWRSRP